MKPEESLRLLKAAQLMLLGNDNQPISDLYYALQDGVDAIEEKLVGGYGEDWRPIKTRPLTEEEKLNAIEKHDIDPDDLEYPFAWHFDCELPKLKEGEQSVDVLVTTVLGFVKVTNFFIDYLGSTCFEDMDEAGEFVAWMPLPERYEAEVQDD